MTLRVKFVRLRTKFLRTQKSKIRAATDEILAHTETKTNESTHVFNTKIAQHNQSLQEVMEGFGRDLENLTGIVTRLSDDVVRLTAKLNANLTRIVTRLSADVVRLTAKLNDVEEKADEQTKAIRTQKEDVGTKLDDLSRFTQHAMKKHERSKGDKTNKVRFCWSLSLHSFFQLYVRTGLL